ncbi:heme lyase NrfEFG subunit NrfG [Edaphovirga cremea]|uniref:heme lyase NrfEFG subunit NrfG n=1 Tax=Edaphovirga cremea TaxID=2267246 RepID=UPI00398A3009
MILIAALLVLLAAVLLWPIFFTQRHSDDGKLQRLSDNIWHFQRDQAGKLLAENEAEQFCRELVHDLPLTPQPTPLSHQPVPRLPVILAVVMIFSVSAGLYMLSPRIAQVRVEQQRLADPLHAFSVADQQEKQLVALQYKIRGNPQDSALWAELGEYYLYRNAYENALTAYQRALLLRGENGELYSALATVLYYQAGQNMTPQAQAMIDKALAQDANEVTALMLLASDAFMRTEYAQAITIWQRLLDTYSPRINRVQLLEAINTAKLLQNSQE